MKSSDFDSSPFFTAADFTDKPQTWIIAAIAAETIGRDNPKKKPVFDLIDGDGKPAAKRLPVNPTNRAALTRTLGDDMDAWIGQSIRIQAIWTTYLGNRVRGIGITPSPVALRAAGRAGAAASADTARRTDPAARKDDFDDAVPF
jgi:hypothetical protein